MTGGKFTKIPVEILFLILFLTHEIEPLVNKDKCTRAHEDYENIDFSAELGEYSKFAVSVDSADCASVGREIFEKNGSVVDVAIATGLCNSLLNLQSMGIGGGHFMNIYIKEENRSYFLNAREIAPANSDQYMFAEDIKRAQVGGLATAIPGELKGYEEAHRRFGKLPWRDLFQPSIELCEKGFRVSKTLANVLRVSEEDIMNNTGLAEFLVDPSTNSVYQFNDTIRLSKLANTLRLVGERGTGEFYNGSLTPIIVDEINKNGGNVTVQDFHNYWVKFEEKASAIKLDDTYKVYANPPPASSVLVPFVLKLMRPYVQKDFAEYEDLEVFNHRLVESFKHAFAQRSLLGDEDYLNLEKTVDRLRNDTFIDHILDKIDEKKTFPSTFYGGATHLNKHGTVIGPNGDAVALTSTINAYFGAKYAGEHTGIIYNNEMDDFSTPGFRNYFSLEPSEPNFIEPGKRPMSSMSPVIIVDNKNDVRLILGASGGSKIITGVSQVALRALWMNHDLKSAVDARRIHHQLYPEYLELEDGFSEYLEEYLDIVGHNITCFNVGGSVIQGIHVNNGKIYAYSDPRKGGKTDGI